MWLRNEFSRMRNVYLVSLVWAIGLMHVRYVESVAPVDNYPYQGMFLPFAPGDPAQLQLPEEAYPTLQDGKVYRRLVLDTKKYTAEAIMVQDIAAPPEIIWNILLDFDDYQSNIFGVMTSQNYRTERPAKNKPFQRRSQNPSAYSTKMTVGIPHIFELESYFHHEYHADDDVLLWTVDHSQASDLDDSVGFWWIQALPNTSSGLPRTRVTYRANISWKKLAWVPEFLQEYLGQKVFTEAVTWVKTAAEQAFAAARPEKESQYDGSRPPKGTRVARVSRFINKRLFPRNRRPQARLEGQIGRAHV